MWKNTYAPKFIAASLTITEMYKQPKCPAKDEWIKDVAFIYIYMYIHTYICIYTYIHMYVYVQWSIAQP